MSEDNEEMIHVYEFVCKVEIEARTYREAIDEFKELFGMLEGMDSIQIYGGSEKEDLCGEEIKGKRLGGGD